MKITVTSKEDLTSIVKSYLAEKGVDEKSAEYLADLYADSAEGKKATDDGEIVPLGNCSLIGLFPG